MARIANGKDPDDLSDVYRGRPTRPKRLEPIDTASTRYMPPAPLSLADAVSQLGVRPVQLAQAYGRTGWPQLVGVAASC